MFNSLGSSQGTGALLENSPQTVVTTKENVVKGFPEMYFDVTIIQTLQQFDRNDLGQMAFQYTVTRWQLDTYSNIQVRPWSIWLKSWYYLSGAWGNTVFLYVFGGKGKSPRLWAVWLDSLCNAALGLGGAASLQQTLPHTDQPGPTQWMAGSEPQLAYILPLCQTIHVLVLKLELFAIFSVSNSEY